MNLKGDSLITLDHDKINEAQKWDGLHGLITNILDVNITEIVKHYLNHSKYVNCCAQQFYHNRINADYSHFLY